MLISSSKALVFCLLAMVLALEIPQIVRAQVDRTKAAADDPPKNKEEAEQRKELEKKTLTLLNDVAGAAWGLKLPENRLFIMSGAADLLWSSDEKRARALYWDALNSLNLMTTPVRNVGPNVTKTEREKVVGNYFWTFELRQKLLHQVAKRDAQLALDMLRASRQIPPRQIAPDIPFPDDLQLEQEIATEVAARDPAKALEIARQTLAKGATFEALNLLHRLNRIDKEKGAQFAGEIITKLRTINLATDFRAAIIGVRLLSASRKADGEARLGSIGLRTFVNLSDEQRRDLVEMLIDAALSATGGAEILFQIREIMPDVERFFPERRAPIERKLAAFNKGMTEGERNQNNYNDLISNGRWEEILRLAATADGDTRQMLYQQAALSALGQGKSEAFRELINKEISDGEDRATVLDVLDTQEISIAAYRKQIDQLQKLLPKIRRKEERARAMAELALMLKEKGEDHAAVTLLDEAATLIKTDLKDEKQTTALLTLLSAFAIVDPPKAFALAERTVDRANSQISLLLLVDRVVKTGAVKKNEIVLEQPNLMPIDFLLFKFGKGVAALARADFNRTRALSERFDRNELRLMAQLLILKGLLRPQPSSDWLDN